MVVGKTVRENVLLMVVMVVVLVGVAFMKVKSKDATQVEGLRGRGSSGGRSGRSGGSSVPHSRGSGTRSGGWFGGDGWRGFLPYWLLSRSAGSTISPSTVNVTQSDPYLTNVSRVTATIQLVVMIAMILVGVYLAYKWLVVNRK